MPPTFFPLTLSVMELDKLTAANIPSCLLLVSNQTGLLFTTGSTAHLIVSNGELDKSIVRSNLVKVLNIIELVSS